MNIFKKFHLYLHYWTAANLADKSYRKYRHRFFVLPGTNGELLVSDRRNFRGLRRKHWVKNADNLDIRQVVEKSFYHTPYADGSGHMTGTERKAKLHDYYDWYVRSRKEYREQAKARKAKEKAKRAREKEARRDARRK